jgi:MYXO-CTERM domain-containing protein
MKKALIAIAALLVSVSAYAQGQVNFKTHITSDTPPIAAQILNADGSVGVGAFAQLVVVGANNSLTPMTEAPGVVNAAGYVSAGAATFAGIAGGTTVNLIMRAWQGAAGSTFDTATIKGSSSPISIQLVEAPGTPNDLIGLTSVTLTPEPTTLALGALGLGALVLYRRKA